jgi:hypothetical protein
MNYYALRTSGVSPTQPGAPVYSTWDALAAVVSALWSPNLSVDVTIYVQGGQTFGQDNAANVGLSPNIAAPGGNGNSHTILVTTDPGELSTPGTILGRIRCGVCSNTNLKITKLKCYGTYSAQGANQVYGFGGGSSYSTTNSFKIEDCFFAINTTADTGQFIFNCLGNGSNSWIKDCTIAYAGNVSSIITVSDLSTGVGMLQHNNLYLVYTSLSTTLNSSPITTAGANKNNTFFNYGSGSYAPLGFISSRFANTISGQNPNLDTALIQSSSDTPATIIARSAELTGASGPCIGNADVGTATATDIVGKARG